MATDRILIEIVTAANLAGINTIKKGMLGLKPGTLALAAGLGLIVVAGKSAVSITEKHDKAQQDLEQALSSTGSKAETVRSQFNDNADAIKAANDWIDKFTDSNRAYIPVQSDVIEGYAILTRSGLTQTEVQKDMNRALDLAALKHIPLLDAINLVNGAEHGRVRGLVDLGITSAKYVDSSGKVVDANHNMTKVMAELDDKTAHGRDTLTATEKATNRLSGDWEEMANIVGPPLLGLFDGIVNGADWILRKLKELGENKDWIKGVSAAFGIWQNLVLGIAHQIGLIVSAIDWVITNAGKIPGWLTSSKPNTGPGGGKPPFPGAVSGYIKSAAGYDGMVSSPTLFLAGEAGKEHVSITPGGDKAGKGITVNVIVQGGLYSDGPGLDRLTMAIANRLGYVTGR